MLSQEQDAIIIKSLPKESGHRSSISGITTVSHWHWPSHLRSINLIFLSLSIGFFPIFPLLALHGTCQDQTTWRWLLGKGHHLTKPYPTVTPSTPHSLSAKKVFLFIRIWLILQEARSQVETRAENHPHGQTFLNFSQVKGESFWLHWRNLTGNQWYSQYIKAHVYCDSQ